MSKFRIESGLWRMGSTELRIGMPILPTSYESDRSQYFFSVTDAEEDYIDLMISSRLQFNAFLRLLQRSTVALNHFVDADDAPFTVTADVVGAGAFSELSMSVYTASYYAEHVDKEFAQEEPLGLDDVVMTLTVLGDGPEFGLGNGDSDSSVVFQLSRKKLKTYAKLFSKIPEMPFIHAGDSLTADWLEPAKLFGVDDLSILASAEIQALLLRHIKNNLDGGLAKSLIHFHTATAFHFPRVSRCEECGGFFLVMDEPENQSHHYSLSSMMERVEAFRPWLTPISLSSEEPAKFRLRYVSQL